MELHLFDQVDQLLHALCPADLGPLRSKAHKYGIKVWFGDHDAPRAHYEAQVLGRKHVDGAPGMALEIGFHAEHRALAENEAIVELLAEHETSWRAVLGDEPELGEFFGADQWRRLSDVWIDQDLGEPDLAIEVASRLVDYVTEIQPILAQRPAE